jgi:UDP:flavonoid glycosyltransferase YjiC (YdhE family)
VELVNGAKYCQPQLVDIIARTKPDVIVEDNVIGFPALNTAGVPFVRIVSCNPLEVKGPAIAPVFSGYPGEDSSGWDTFRAEYDRTHRPLWTEFNDWYTAQGAPGLPDLEFIAEGDLNLYVYPSIADYTERRPLGPAWQRLESSVRETDGDYALPDGFASRKLFRRRPRLIYFSLGSLGSADVELMKRIIAVLAKTPHRYIVSKGPLHNELTLAPNMVGAEFLPQTKILPKVDLVITHGGNNTVTEALHFGKPMVVLPLFWDQYDNAQRLDELGLGKRLDTYRFTDEELIAAIDALLSNDALRVRLQANGESIRAADGLRRAADAIEALA